MPVRTLALVGAAPLAGALALGTLGTALVQSPPAWSPGGRGPGGMMGGFGPMVGGQEMMGGEIDEAEYEERVKRTLA